jgi:hypothetical protein
MYKSCFNQLLAQERDACFKLERLWNSSPLFIAFLTPEVKEAKLVSLRALFDSAKSAVTSALFVGLREQAEFQTTHTPRLSKDSREILRKCAPENN